MIVNVQIHDQIVQTAQFHVEGTSSSWKNGKGLVQAISTGKMDCKITWKVQLQKHIFGTKRWKAEWKL